MTIIPRTEFKRGRIVLRASADLLVIAGLILRGYVHILECSCICGCEHCEYYARRIRNGEHCEHKDFICLYRTRVF